METISQEPGIEQVTCAGCKTAVPASSIEIISGHAICKGCLETARARHAEPAAPIVDEGTTAPSVLLMVEAKAQPCTAGDYVRALLMGLLVAVAGAFIWDKLTMWTGYMLAIVAIALGVAVGVAVRTGARERKGAVLPFIGAALAGFSILLGYILLCADAGGAAFAKQVPQYASMNFFEHAILWTVTALSTMEPMDWVFVAVGVWEGWNIPRKGKPAQHKAMPDNNGMKAG